MANICSYCMKVTGEPDKIREFIEVIQRDNYEEGRHFYRVFSADVMDEGTIDDGWVQIIGSCAWSVYSCMMEGNATYSEKEFDKYQKTKQEIEALKKSPDLASKNNYFFAKEKIEKEFLASSLIRESKLLNLTIEVFSEEYGCCFEEHFVIKNGEVLVDECVEAYEIYTEDYESVEKLNEEHGTNFSEHEFKEEMCLIKGGFGDWEFDEY